MKDEKKAPKLRFKGFTDDWEQCKLGDVFVESTEKSKDDNEELLSVTLKDGVIKAKLLDRKNNASFDKKKYKLVIPNDIAYNSMRMWQGALGVSKYRGIVSPAYTVIKLRNQLENPYFYQYYFKKSETLNLFRKNSQGLTSDTWNLKYPLFSRIHFFTTSVEEQQKISSLLNLLDRTITLHEEKKHQLDRLKSALLQKIFVDKSSYPAVRFVGFKNAWEQCKLGDVCEVYDGIHQTPDYQDHGIMFLSVENISTLTSNKFISREYFEQNFKIFPERGDILLTRIGNVGTPNVVEKTDRLAYYVSLALLKAPKIDSYFLCNLICTQKFKKELHSKTLTTAIPQKINKDEIRKVTFFNSTNCDEQKRIGLLLRTIHLSITLHDHKLELLKRMKQSLLQKMFI